MAAASLLANLPSRGTLTDAQGVVVSRAPTHVCSYDTAPPADQVITTDPTNILIRALTSRRAARESSQKGPATPKDRKGKRPAASVDTPGSAETSSKRERREVRTPDGKGSDSRCAQAGSSSGQKVSKAELESYTVEKLRAFLKERNMPLRGRKEELLARAKRLFGYK